MLQRVSSSAAKRASRVRSAPIAPRLIPSRRHSSVQRDALSVAPMMGVTDRHMRYFLRMLSARTVLYTEMVTDTDITRAAKAEMQAAAATHSSNQPDQSAGQPPNSQSGSKPSKDQPKPKGGGRGPPPPLRDVLIRKAGHNRAEQPLVLQFGGSDPESLSIAAAAVANSDHHFSEFNLNCGCPAPSAESGRYGAVLMLRPQLVRDICSSMKRSSGQPVTVKCRIGVDDRESYQELCEFISTVAEAGVDHFVIHARKCLLKGLSAAQNRTVPPLRHEVVYALVKEFPSLRFTLNGGVDSLADARAHLDRGVHGVMMGRAMSENPLQLLLADHLIYGESLESGPAMATNWTRRQLVTHFGGYADSIAFADSQRRNAPSPSLLNSVGSALPGRFNPRQVARAQAQAEAPPPPPPPPDHHAASVFTMLKPLQTILHGLPHSKTFSTRLYQYCLRHREAVRSGEMLPSQLLARVLEDIDSERDGPAVGTGVTLKWMMDLPLLESYTLALPSSLRAKQTQTV